MKAEGWLENVQLGDLGLKVVNQLSYSEHCVRSLFESDNWYQEITDYFEMNIQSFGIPGIGEHIYINNLRHYLNEDPHPKERIDEDHENINLKHEKLQKLIGFLEDYQYSEDHPKEIPDLNLLAETYQKWLNAFPDLSYFTQIKKLKFPIGSIIYDQQRNIYTGIVKSKVRTNAEFLKILLATTKQLLSAIDTVKMVREGLITDVNKHQIDLINNNHRLKQMKLVGDFSDQEQENIAIIQKWLSNEKWYFEEIAPVLREYERNRKRKPSRRFFSLKQIAIANYAKRVHINVDNYLDILAPYTTSSSKKIFQHRIRNDNELIALRENKRADQQHFRDLEAAKRLLIGEGSKIPVKRIDEILQRFQEAFDKHY